jgi:hypothetical protein
MKVLVCGGRDFNDYQLLEKTLNYQHYGVGAYPSKNIELIIQGYARGADRLAHTWATRHFVKSTGDQYEADWGTYGRAAGHIRNALMLKEQKPDLVIAFPTPESVGTWDMVDKATAAGVSVIVI